MILYTSYFYNIRNFNNIVPISISLYKPKWYNGEVYSKLYPTDKILRDYKSTGDIEKYRESYYNDVLSKLSVSEVCKDLADIMIKHHGCRSIALVCYESPDKFCHRKLVSEWLTSHGIMIEEFR